MSNIKKLLEGVEVEWKTLGEVAENVSSGKNKRKVLNGKYPVFGSTGIIAYTDTYKYNFEQILVARVGANAGYVHKANGYYDVSDNTVIINVKPNIVLQYLFYLLQKMNLNTLAKGGGQPLITAGELKKLLIPIPCPDDPEKSLEIQKEVVCILDKFSELTAELTAELQARKTQYEYYRNQLLTYPMEESDHSSLRSSQSATSIQNINNPTQPLSALNPHTGNSVLQSRGKKVEWKMLGEIGEVCMCKRILKERTSDIGDIPFYKIGTFGKEPDAYISKELFNEYKSKYSYPKIGEVLISASGTIGRAVFFDGKDAYFQDSNIVWIENDESQILNRYLFHFYPIAKWEISEGGTIQRLYNNNLKKTRIPIPYPDDIKKSLEEQERIVAILDKFDTLTTSITEGLPKEIELRQKQYEYYRDLLLTFPKNNIKA